MPTCLAQLPIARIPGLLVASPLDLPTSAANSLDSRIAGCQPTCLDLPSPAANSLDSRIAGCQTTCLDLPSSAANSLDSRIACCQPTCLAQLPRAWIPGLLVVSPLAQLPNAIDRKTLFGVHARVSYIYRYICILRIR